MAGHLTDVQMGWLSGAQRLGDFQDATKEKGRDTSRVESWEGGSLWLVCSKCQSETGGERPEPPLASSGLRPAQIRPGYLGRGYPSAQPGEAGRTGELVHLLSVISWAWALGAAWLRCWTEDPELLSPRDPLL